MGAVSNSDAKIQKMISTLSFEFTQIQLDKMKNRNNVRTNLDNTNEIRIHAIFISYTTELMIPFSQIKLVSINWSVRWTKQMLLSWKDSLLNENTIEKSFSASTKSQILFELI